MRVHVSLVASVLVVHTSAAPPAQVPLRGLQPEHVAATRPLHGRFLQITDFHPDRFYQIYSSTSEDAACHRGQGPAGIYGAETSECDSPIALINKTMEFVAKEFRDKVDFVIWTGDSARHDNDDAFPRTSEQVLELNRFMVHKMAEAFGKHNGEEEDGDPNNDFIIPIVPNLGNNDILPHNILAKGPNQWIRTYAGLWRQFIPQVQSHSFEQGGWFYVEVIPQKLAVFSLNTLYFFGSNAAADGCALRGEPGYQQMEWLRVQLQFMRDRGMKAILIGHVPPVRQEAKTSWDETCWQKYTLWNRQYRDVILSSHYGHFNYDHFMFQDFKDLDKDTKKGRMQYLHGTHDDEDFSAQVKTDYFLQLRDEWSELPSPPEAKSTGWLDAVLGKKKDKFKKKQKKYFQKIGGKYAERFSASFVSASVVPNLFPTMRVFEYNITGLEGHSMNASTVPPPAPFDFAGPDVEIEGKEKKKTPKKYQFTVPEAPSKSSPPGPAYSPQTFSLLKYTQYFANLTYINKDFARPSEESDVEAAKWHEGTHKGKKPHEKDRGPNPRKFQYEVLYDTKEDDVYHLDDLTMPSLIDLARRIGHFEPEDESAVVVVVDEEGGGGEPCCPESTPDDVGNTKHKKHKKKNKKRKEKHHHRRHKGEGRRHREQNEAWFTFVRRAYVETLSPDQLDEEFG